MNTSNSILATVIYTSLHCKWYTLSLLLDLTLTRPLSFLPSLLLALPLTRPLSYLPSLLLALALTHPLSYLPSLLLALSLTCPPSYSPSLLLALSLTHPLPPGATRRPEAGCCIYFHHGQVSHPHSPLLPPPLHLTLHHCEPLGIGSQPR